MPVAMIPVYDGGCTMRNPDAHLRDDVREAGGMDTFEDGSISEPSIESNGLTETGQRIDEEAEFRN